ncbi:MAG: ATPase [Spirochaetales bacterium]|nr:ATPase [Spirochaetales bacterium]
MAVIFMVNVPSLFAQEKAGGSAQESGQAAQSESVKAEVTKFAFIAAALAFGFGAIGAGLAVGNVGAAAMGAIGEKPEIAGQAIIFVALAEGLAIFGFIVAILILGRV